MIRGAAKSLRGCRLDEFARQYLTPEILDFASGAPVLAAPRAFRVEAARAVTASLQGYGDSAGLVTLRAAIAAKFARIGLDVDANGTTITTGATGALQAAFLGIAEPGDEVLTPVPAYEPIFDIIRLAGATPVSVRLDGPSWELRAEALQRAITHRTRAIYLNQPANPIGRIYTSAEMEIVGRICCERNLVVVEDSVYDEFFYTNRPMTTGADVRMRDRVVRVGSFSKTHAIPGWRLGFVAASGWLGERIRRIAETMTGGAAAPLQSAIVAAGIDAAVDFEKLRSDYLARRDRLTAVLTGAGFRVPLPDGGIYVFAKCPSGLNALGLLSRGIAAIPGAYFYPDEEGGATYARFCFARPFSQIDALGSALPRPDPIKAPLRVAKPTKGEYWHEVRHP